MSNWEPKSYQQGTVYDRISVLDFCLRRQRRKPNVSSVNFQIFVPIDSEHYPVMPVGSIQLFSKNRPEYKQRYIFRTCFTQPCRNYLSNQMISAGFQSYCLSCQNWNSALRAEQAAQEAFQSYCLSCQNWNVVCRFDDRVDLSFNLTVLAVRTETLKLWVKLWITPAVSILLS